MSDTGYFKDSLKFIVISLLVGVTTIKAVGKLGIQNLPVKEEKGESFNMCGLTTFLPVVDSLMYLLFCFFFAFPYCNLLF